MPISRGPENQHRGYLPMTPFPLAGEPLSYTRFLFTYPFTIDLPLALATLESCPLSN